MEIDPKQKMFLRMLPGIDSILEFTRTDPFFRTAPNAIVVRCVRSVIEGLRTSILGGDQGVTEERLADSLILEEVKNAVRQAMTPNLIQVVNATGVVVHTNLGRSLLADKAIENISDIAGRYSNLEFDLSAGKRGSRYTAVEDILCEITGAESAMVVNNNAGAAFLCLETIAKGKKVIVSRGELVEIGGSFRIPDVLAKSGCILKEVGTTNRTHLKDYEGGIESDTGLLLKVHKSNYSVVGFTAEVPLKALVDLAAKFDIPVMEDLGSGTFIDFSDYGLTKEPTVQESVASGADIVTFSGDKLLGGPQAGIIVGKKDILDKIKQNSLTRALRIDKLTLAALESTLRLYIDPETAVATIPTLRMLTLPLVRIEEKADRLFEMLTGIDDSRMNVQLLDRSSRAGGGSLPLLELPSKCVGVTIQGISANAIERSMREAAPPIIGRIEEDVFVMDLRTIQDDEFQIINNTIGNILKRFGT